MADGDGNRRDHEIWLISQGAMKPAEQVLAQTLQGLTGRQRPRIWLRGGSMYQVVEEQLRREGVPMREAASVWELLAPFKAEVKGAVLYRLGTPSLNVAASLCGPLGAVAVDESLQERATAEGLPILLDVRDKDEVWAFREHRQRFARGVLVEQALDKPRQMRDFSVAHDAFTFATRDSAFRTEVARAFGPQALVYGWGGDESTWVRDLSAANATGCPADWCINLSALQRLPARALRRPRRPALTPINNTRYLAFVLSDGDNIQWLIGSFADNARFWASPLRGRFPMTWEVSPLLADVAPRVLEHLYSGAKETDGFVTGAGLPGYTFAHYQPDPVALARQSRDLLRASDLSVASALNANEGRLAQMTPLLDQPEIDGVLYKAYAPYHRNRGELFWHRGKPCLSYRFVLWEGLMEPDDIVREVEKMPQSPRTDPASYAIVNVHAWSYGKSGGPLEAVRRTIERLPANVRVVTADQIVGALRTHFGTKQR